MDDKRFLEKEVIEIGRNIRSIKDIPDHSIVTLRNDMILVKKYNGMYIVGESVVYDQYDAYLKNEYNELFDVMNIKYDGKIIFKRGKTKVFNKKYWENKCFKMVLGTICNIVKVNDFLIRTDYKNIDFSIEYVDNYSIYPMKKIDYKSAFEKLSEYFNNNSLLIEVGEFENNNIAGSRYNCLTKEDKQKILDKCIKQEEL